MAKDVRDLIENLALRGAADTGFDTPSPRDQAIAALLERGPDVVTALIGRLEDLLAAAAAHHRRVAAVTKAWDAWYEESERLIDDHGALADVERYRTIPTESLPQPSAEDDAYRDPYELKQGIIEALRRCGDQRAAPVIIAALADRACVHTAARALRDIRSGLAVPALLDAVTLITPDDNVAFPEILVTLQDYGASIAQARERFEAETSPQGRVSLMHLLTKMPDDGTGRPPESLIRNSLVFQALDHRDTVGRWKAIRALRRIDHAVAEEFSLSAMDAPPPADVVRSAITLAAHGNPPGHDRELIRRLRNVANTRPATRAIEAALTEDSPEPDVRELRLALRLALRVNTSELTDPMRLVRALHRLSSHPELADRAQLALRRGDLLLGQVAAGDGEARTIFEAVATPDDRARLAGFTVRAAPRPALLRRIFRRR